MSDKAVFFLWMTFTARSIRWTVRIIDVGSGWGQQEGFCGVLRGADPVPGIAKFEKYWQLTASVPLDMENKKTHLFGHVGDEKVRRLDDQNPDDFSGINKF